MQVDSYSKNENLMVNLQLTKFLGNVEIESLQLENRRLTDLVEDLNVQLLNQHVSRARALSDPMKMDQSFAEEFNEATKDQVKWMSVRSASYKGDSKL